MFEFSGKVFRMPNTRNISEMVNFTCQFDFDSLSSNWLMFYNGSGFDTIPDCLYHCLKSPIPIDYENLVADLNEEHWSDSIPIFSCDNGKNDNK